MYEFWFGLFQSIGAIATAIALVFVVLQTYYTRKQASSMQHEITIRLRPWIYRMPGKEEAFEFPKDRVRMYFNNTGQVAAHSISFYYAFKNNEPDETMYKMDIEDSLLNEKPIVREKLLVPNEETYLDMTMDQSVLRSYVDGFAILLHVSVRYKFAGGNDEREGSYLGIFRMEKSSSSGGYNAEIVREWAE